MRCLNILVVLRLLTSEVDLVLATAVYSLVCVLCTIISFIGVVGSNGYAMA